MLEIGAGQAMICCVFESLVIGFEDCVVGLYAVLFTFRTKVKQAIVLIFLCT